MTDVVFALDVEDVVHPESDDALLALCRIFTEEEVPLSLFVAGEKARTLRRRGRQDVITAMGRHEICYHGNYWGEFPEPALVYGSRLGFDEAVKLALSIELPGLHDVAEITSQFPVAWCCHQAQQAPPLSYAYKLAGVRCWAGGPRGWIMNWLSWPRSNCAIDMQGSWSELADPARRDRPKPPCDPVADLLAVQAGFERTVANHDFVSFLGHPVCWVASHWALDEWTVLFRHGVAGAYPRPASFRPAKLRSPEDRAAAMELTRLILRWVKTRSDANLTSYTALCARDEEDPRLWLTWEQVVDLARQALERFSYQAAQGTTFSCADVTGVLLFAVQYLWDTGSWPQRVPVQRLLGPTEAPLNVGKPLAFAREDLIAGSLAAYAVMMDERRLPGKLKARFVDVGPAELRYALARFVVQAAETGELPLQVEVPALPMLPDCVHEPAITERRFGSSHRPADWTPDHLWDMLKWQSWSYRPVAREA